MPGARCARSPSSARDLAALRAASRGARRASRPREAWLLLARSQLREHVARHAVRVLAIGKRSVADVIREGGESAPRVLTDRPVDLDEAPDPLLQTEQVVRHEHLPVT